MTGFLYYLVLPFIYLLSIIPFRLLYWISDGVYLVLYYIVDYRKEVIFTNLQKSFPEKSAIELKLLHQAFLRYFCDLLLESFKTLTISKASMLQRCSMEPAAQLLFDQLAADKQNVILVMGHQGNWEWAGNTFSLLCQQQLYVIYHPLANPYFNDLISKMRRRFGNKLIAMKDTFREMVKNKGELNATAFIADQSPNPATAYWMEFLNQDTAVFMGTEKIAQKLKYPVVFVSVKRVKRGFYTLGAELLQSPPYEPIEGQITEIHTRKLASEIIQQPETWLWTHKRWKHQRF